MALTRRDFGRNVLAGVAATTLTGATGCGNNSSGASGTGGANTCTLYPQQTAGPFYLDLDQLRQEITEGKSGVTLTVTVKVQNQACESLKDLAVDLWHCDAEGVYSGFPGQPGGLDTTGETFLRGTQVTDVEGIAEFTTIYPGWYPGRTTHLHFRVHTSSSTQATSQLYFPEDVTEEIYRTAPYDARGQKDTPNARDGVAGGALPPLATVTGNSEAGYTATIIVTVA